jgi:acid phosphatase type 7
MRTRRLPAALLAAAVFLLGAASARADATLAAAGDVACAPNEPYYFGGRGDATHCAQGRTAGLIGSLGAVDAVLPLGDTQYNSGKLADFRAAYGPSWGRFLGQTRPVVGNHEYGTSGAGGYFDYFGARAGARGKGWYSYDLAGWHLVALNSECDKIGSAQCSTQESWLKADLAGHPAACTLAYWHEPPFSSGKAPVKNQAYALRLWGLLAAARADVVLTAHKHFYERFAPRDGMVQMIVGTGGRDHAGTPGPIAGSVTRNAKTFGVLRVGLHAGSWDAAFVPEPDGSYRDQTWGACH